MLPIDVQAEIIRSFQEEKRRRFLEMRQQQRAGVGLRLSLRARFLRLSGQALVTAGRTLQRYGDVPATEFESRRLSWEK